MPPTAASSPSRGTSSPPFPSRRSPSSSESQWTTHGSNLTTLHCLSRSSPPRPALPLEIILQVIDHPTRWIRAHYAASQRVHVTQAERPIILLPRFTAREIKLLRRLVFRIRSRDQGWSWDRRNHGTFAGSCTWFEAVVRKADEHDEDPSGRDNHGVANDETVKKKFELQRNRHAGTEFEDYEIVWENGDERMAELKDVLMEGDVLELRACARFPAWVNEVEMAEIETWCLDEVGRNDACSS
ncbi:MAG: hypothetical protein Q9201_004551 [Fulgogasparrea decipioides]